MTSERDLSEFKESLGPQEIKPEDEEVDLAAVNRALRRFGTAPVHPSFPRRSRGLYISEQAMLGLQTIAASENLFVVRGRLMGTPSVSELLECIGLGVYRVVPEEVPPSR